VTIILGGDSLFHNRKTPTINPGYEDGSPRRRALGRVRQDGDSTGDPRTRLGIFVCVMPCVVVFLYE
jgi:hypothetical protein